MNFNNLKIQIGVTLIKQTFTFCELSERMMFRCIYMDAAE